MPYVGNTPSTSFATVTKDAFSGDGSTVGFTLSKVATTNSVSVFVENVRQEPTVAYSVSGTTLTFTAAPVSSSGNNIYVLHMLPTSTATHPAAQNLTAVDGTFTGDVTITDDLNVGDDLLLTSDSSVIKLGSDADVTITHDPDDGLILKSTATADDNPFLLTLQTGETDLAANDVIGKIAFQAPDEGTGTDAVLVSAAIQAVAEGDHSSSSNASSLVFMTGASEAAAEKVRIDSAGNISIGNGANTNDGIIHINGGSSAKNIVIEADRDSDGQGLGNLQFHSAGTNVVQVSAERGSSDAKADLVLYTNGGSLTERMRIDEDGHITKPTQSAFLVRPDANSSALTANSYFTIEFDEEIFDNNADFNTTNYTFTAPVTGRYQLNFSTYIYSLDTAADYYLFFIDTSNGAFNIILDPGGYSTDINYRSFVVNHVVDMDASDTAVVKAYQQAGSNQTLVIAGNYTYFSGYLVA